MNKAELVSAMAEKTALSKKDAEAALKAFTDIVAEELKKGAAPLEIIYSTDSFHQAFGEAMQAYVEGSASKEDTISTIEQKYQEIDGASN